jgi:hypothetical protein
VLDALRDLRALALSGAGEADTAVKTVTTSLAYLEKRAGQIRYADFAAAGYPLASGATESANKLVIEARLKGAGRHWAPAHVNPMAALRTVAASDRWAEAWPQIGAQRRRQARAQAATRRRARRAAAAPASVAAPAPRLTWAAGELCWRDSVPVPAPPAPPPTAPAGPRRPPVSHPWRRGHLSRRAASLARQTTRAEL